MSNEREFINTAHWALAASDQQVGPACANVRVPATIVMDDDFREAYVQGYRHALSDVRKLSAADSSGEARESILRYLSPQDRVRMAPVIDQALASLQRKEL